MAEQTAPREQNEPRGELVPFPGAPAVPAADTSYEIALDDGTAAAEPVNRGEGIPLPARPGERRPVIPEHLRTWAGVRGTAARHGGLLAHRGAYHGLRSPGYLLKATGWALYGLLVILERLRR